MYLNIATKCMEAVNCVSTATGQALQVPSCRHGAVGDVVWFLFLFLFLFLFFFLFFSFLFTVKPVLTTSH